MANEASTNPPIPDPTTLTTAQLEKAVEAERDWAQGQFGIVDARLNAAEHATELRLETIGQIPDRIDEKVRHLRELSDERFTSIQVQFKERDTRSERESTLNQTAVNAAFSAQKEASARQDDANQKAIDKSEKATAETINKLAELFETRTAGLAGQIADIKAVVGSIVSSKQGGKDATAALYALAGFLAVIISIAVTIFATRTP